MCVVSQIHMSFPDFPFHVEGVVDVQPERTTVEQVLASLQLSGEEAAKIAHIPQGTHEWLNARKYRITASNFGAAIGMNKYNTPRGLLKDLLWNTFRGNAATKWGSDHEDVARDAYVKYMQDAISAGTSVYTSLRVEETGLHVNSSRPWLGSSPDGVVHVTTRDGGSHRFLLEIKCPYSRRFYNPPVPPHYKCQIQGMMANMNLPYCDFVVWIPGSMQITRVQFDAPFWETTLLPGLHKFYHEMYLPRVVAKMNGELEEGEIDTVLHL